MFYCYGIEISKKLKTVGKIHLKRNSFELILTKGDFGAKTRPKFI